MPQVQLQLTEEEIKVFLPFYEHLNRKRLALDNAQREFIEYLLSQRKAPSNEPINSTTEHAAQHAPASESASPPDAATGINGK